MTKLEKAKILSPWADDEYILLHCPKNFGAGEETITDCECDKECYNCWNSKYVEKE